MTAAENTHHALVVHEREYDGLAMAMSPAEAKRRLQELQAFVQDAMVKDVDYGTIPGTPKPTLYQQGAQKLAEIYGFSHQFIPVEAQKDWERGFFYFEFRCVLMSRRNGTLIGEGIGSSNSREAKYAWRWMSEDELPEGTDKTKLVKQSRDEWLFANKLPKGADKAKLKSEERVSQRTGGKYTVYAISTVKYRVPNPDVADVVNTLQKMACKRAYVHAVIAATRSSGMFTQDLEDLPREVFGKAEEKRSWEETEEPAATVAATETKEAPVARSAKAAPAAPAAPAVTPPTDAQAKLYEECRPILEACDSLAALNRVVKTIGEYVRQKKLVQPHIDDLRKLATTVQKRLRAAQAQEPADAEPPNDAQTVDDQEPEGRQPGED